MAKLDSKKLTFTDQQKILSNKKIGEAFFEFFVKKNSNVMGTYKYKT